jgi:hypothetical protein
MEEDYIEQDDSAGAASRRPFLTAVGVLLLIFLAAASCGALTLFNRGGSDAPGVATGATVSAIETQNAIVAVTNEAVTATIMAMETEAARPTETPTLPPTATLPPTPSQTPVPPTETPVVADGSGDGGDGDVAPPNISGTSVFGDAAEGTPTPIPVLTGNDKGSLPDTGFDVWSAMLIGLALVAVLFMARRLRGA